MSVQKLNKTAKSLYDDIVRIRTETKLGESHRKHFNRNEPNRSSNKKQSSNPKNNTNVTNDIALNTVMRQMMDMIKESNEIITELSSKVRTQEIKISSFDQNFGKLQTGYRQLDVIVNNNSNELKNLHRNSNQNELTLRELFLKMGAGTGQTNKNTPHSMKTESMFKGIADRLRKLEDSEDLMFTNNHSPSPTVVPTFPSMIEIQTSVQQNLMKSVNETRADVEHELKNLKNKTKDDMKILENKLENIERIVLKNRNKNFDSHQPDVPNYEAEFRHLRSEFKSEIRSELQKSQFNTQSDISRRKLVAKTPLDDKTQNLNVCKLRDIIKIEQTVERLKSETESKIDKLDQRYSEKFASLRDRYEEKESSIGEKLRKFEKKLVKFDSKTMSRQASNTSISLLPPLLESKTCDNIQFTNQNHNFHQSHYNNRPNTTAFREKTQKVFNTIFKSERKRVAETLQAIIDSLRGEIDERTNNGRKRVESLIFSDMAKRDNQFEQFEKRVSILSNRLENILPEMAKHSRICQMEFKKVVDESKENLLKEAGKLTDKSRSEITTIAEEVERRMNGLGDEQDFQRGDYLKNFENITKVVDQLERKYNKQSQGWRLSAEERFDEVLKMVKDTGS